MSQTSTIPRRTTPGEEVPDEDEPEPVEPESLSEPDVVPSGVAVVSPDPVVASAVGSVSVFAPPLAVDDEAPRLLILRNFLPPATSVLMIQRCILPKTIELTEPEI